MLLWGFIFLVAGLLTCLALFLANWDVVVTIYRLGFGGFVSRFFDKANVNVGKTMFMVGAAAIVVGLVLYLIGRARNKKKGEDNPVIPAKVTKFFRDTKGEFKKIVWPGFPSVVRNTLVVLAMCAVTAAVIIVVDSALGGLVNLLLNL